MKKAASPEPCSVTFLDRPGCKDDVRAASAQLRRFFAD